MSARGPFHEFVRTQYHGAQADYMPPLSLERLRPAASEINCLRVFQTWNRERWPRWYVKRNEGDEEHRTGKQIVEDIWADYLAWSEEES